MQNNKPLKVCYVLKRYPRFSETFIVNEILALEAQGVEICIIAIKPPTEGVFHENLSRVRARVRYLPQLSASPGKFLPQLSKAIDDYGLQPVRSILDQDAASLEYGLQAAQMAQEFGADVIHAHFATSASAIARVASLLTGIPYTITAHAKDIFHDQVETDALQQRLADAARVVTVSDFNVDYLRTHFPYSAGRVGRIYNGMPLQSLPVRDEIKPGRTLVTVGRLIEKKGIDDLLSAVALIRTDIPEIHCHVIGDGPLFDHLNALAQALELQRNVTFHGLLPQHQVHQYMAEADAFVAPCVVSSDGDRDGLPTVLLEAMAIGTPCISTPVTGIPEVIKDRETGLLVPEHDPLSIAHACTTLLGDGDLARFMSRNAKALINKRFDIMKNTQELADLWRSVSLAQTEAVA